MPYKSKYFEIAEDSAGDEFIICSDEVLAIPLTAEGEVIFVREPAPAFGREQPLLLPGGTLAEGEAPDATANRELQEEIGYRAARLDHLATLRPWSKYLRVTSHIYLARDLTPSKLEGDEDYEIGLEPRPLATLDALFASGELRDARVIAALFLARDHLAI